MWRVGFLRRADLLVEEVVDRVEGAVVPPFVEVTPDGGLWRKVLEKVTPLTAGSEDVEDGIDDSAQVGLARPPVM
jgi:hypothetical protein